MSIDNYGAFLSFPFSSVFVTFFLINASGSCLKMISGKIIWLFLVQFIIFKGCCGSNTSYTTVEEVITSEITTPLPVPSVGVTFSHVNKTSNVLTTPLKNESQPINSSSHNHLEVVEIFHSDLNTKTTEPTEFVSLNDTITNCLNATSTNITCIEQSWNDTIKTNYTTLAEAVGASEDLPPFRLQNTAAVAAGVFLVSAVLGYISCVGYRQFLQRKYGNSQILAGEETYDTTDLKYFEI